ncbi:SMI1/KNR4 family protein [Tenacibaculum sp. MEBiC06402]|uniref:SMI1/KNR4 family protein n=1 Tax=unclassified Tenacibaculum TaxID=2635139 RepID=UPI003B9BD19F
MEGKTTLKIFVISIVLASVLGFMYLKNKDTSKSAEHNVSDKVLIKKAKQQIDSIKQSSLIEDTMMELIINLADDYSKHKNIGTKLSDNDISKIEERLELTLPESYKLFLKYFGDGAELVYNAPVLNSKKIDYLNKLNKEVNETIESDIATYKSSNLLSLTRKSKDGTAWYWFVDKTKEDNEWSLVYFNSKNQSIEHEVESFTKWVELLVSGKSNVVTELQNKINSGVSTDITTSSYLK